MSISTGQHAPDFTLVNTNKEEVNLHSIQDQHKLVLFFPLAFTGVCTKELCMMRDELGKYQDLNARVMGISIDSVFVLEKFKNEQNLNFDLLSDFNKEAASAYSALHDEFVFGMKGVAKRSAFIVDKNNVVQYAEVLDDPTQLPDFDAIQAKLGSLN